MNTSELRKGILRALDEARREASTRRTAVDEANTAFTVFLSEIAVPLVRQAADVLKAEGQVYVVHTPPDSVRLVSESAPHTFLELVLDTSGARPEVVGRVSITRGRQGQVLEERPIVTGTAVDAVNEDDVAQFLLAAIPKLVLKR